MDAVSTCDGGGRMAMPEEDAQGEPSPEDSLSPVPTGRCTPSLGSGDVDQLAFEKLVRIAAANIWPPTGPDGGAGSLALSAIATFLSIARTGRDPRLTDPHSSWGLLCGILRNK